MEKDVERVLLTQEQIAQKVKELGEQIAQDYAGKNLMLVGILKGAMVFMADLMRAINIPITIDFMMVSSYGSGTKTTGHVKILKDLDYEVKDQDILFVEDIIDSGVTLEYLSELMRLRGAKSVKLCALLNKPERRKVEVDVDYCGFDIPDEFVIGYGLDYGESYRNLPYVGVLKRKIYEDND
jgi:hypoxanthine phosphoribosyltransferase